MNKEAYSSTTSPSPCGQDGKKLEEFDPKNYLDYIGEHVEDWSYLKVPLLP